MSADEGLLKKRIKPLIDGVQEEPDSVVMNILNDDIGKVLDEAKVDWNSIKDYDEGLELKQAWFERWFGK